MGFTLQFLHEEPIIIATAQGMLTVQDFAEMFSESSRMLQGVKHTVYRISDFREATTSFLDLIKMSKLASQGNEGSTTDTRIKAILVGSSQWVSLARTIFEQPQYSAMRLPTLETLDDALVYVRAQLAKQVDESVVSEA